jgi:D-sedoheptulose 7-phosphate isomerase
LTPLNPETLIEKYLDESILCLQKLKEQSSIIFNISRIIEQIRDKNKNIFLIGNGGSASTASHFVCDLNKTSTMNSKKRLRSISLIDNMSILTAIGNDISYDKIFTEQLKNFLTEDDLLIIISGSGNSANIINAATFAKTKKCSVVGITGFNGGKLKSYCDECIIIPSDSMYRIEDMHLMINHILTEILRDGTDYK